MKILMIAPEPFFESRGTPFSVFHRCKALAKLGHKIDLLVYHIGENVELENTRVIRIPKIPFMKKVKIGPSIKKIFLDFFVLASALFLMLKNKYDAIHTHEEAGLVGVFLKLVFNKPLIHDMHSSWPHQLRSYSFTENKFIISFVEYLERLVIKRSDAVIVICPELGEIVKRYGKDKKIFVIENIALTKNYWEASKKDIEKLRKKLNLEDKKVVLYTGSLGPQQNIELIIRCAEHVKKQYNNIIFLLVGGGDKEHIDSLKKMAKKLAVDEIIIFTGQRPVEEMSVYYAIADILISPRTLGTNVPLKIYSYLNSRKPIVATNLRTHTQVLNDNVAILTEPTPENFAEGIIKLLEDEKLREKIGNAAKSLVDRDYSYEKYLNKTNDVYEYIQSIGSSL